MKNSDNKNNCNKTTKDQFELFKKECEFWIDYFGLKGWRVEYSHKKTVDEARADIIWNCAGRIATITLNTIWVDEDRCVITNDNVRRSAFHEVCELFLARLNMMANGKIDNQPHDVNEETHNLIRTLENTIFKKAI